MILEVEYFESRFKGQVCFSATLKWPDHGSDYKSDNAHNDRHWRPDLYEISELVSPRTIDPHITPPSAVHHELPTNAALSSQQICPESNDHKAL